MCSTVSRVSLAVIGLAQLLTGCSGTPDADAPYTVAGLNAVTGGGKPGQAEVVGVPAAIRAGSVVLQSARPCRTRSGLVDGGAV
jgi:hypothetical protein